MVEGGEASWWDSSWRSLAGGDGGWVDIGIARRLKGGRTTIRELSEPNGFIRLECAGIMSLHFCARCKEQGVPVDGTSIQT